MPWCFQFQWTHVHQFVLEYYHFNWVIQAIVEAILYEANTIGCFALSNLDIINNAHEFCVFDEIYSSVISGSEKFKKSIENSIIQIFVDVLNKSCMHFLIRWIVTKLTCYRYQLSKFPKKTAKSIHYIWWDDSYIPLWKINTKICTNIHLYSL